VLPILLLCAAAALAPGSNPRLVVTDARPAAVVGTGFHAHERVTVRLRAPGIDRTRHRRATAGGRFAATFTHAIVDRCTGFLVTAAGADGSRARVRQRALRECAPP
jgi:hypothetical protein